MPNDNYVDEGQESSFFRVVTNLKLTFRQSRGLNYDLAWLNQHLYVFLLHNFIEKIFNNVRLLASLVEKQAKAVGLKIYVE